VNITVWLPIVILVAPFVIGIVGGTVMSHDARFARKRHQREQARGIDTRCRTMHHQDQ
jgi:hypothetical protein